MTTLLLRFLVSLLLATLTGSVFAQRTWIVDRWNRPGADFADLPAATAAAADGDHVFLRATVASSSLVDCYLAPTILGKGLIIYGETGTGIPRPQILGLGSVSGVPSTSTMLFSNVDLGHRMNFGMSIQLVSNSGAVVFRGVNLVGFSPFTFANWSDCSLIILEGCTLMIDEGRLTLLRSKVMMSSTRISKERAQSNVISPALIADNSEVHLNACTLIGASPSTQVPLGCSEGMAMWNGTILHSSGSTRFQGGGQCPDLTAYVGTNYSFIDPSTVFAHGFTPDATHHYALQTGISTTTVGNTIHIDQSQYASMLTFLAMAPLTTSPWSNILGPVYLDPNFVWTDLAVSPPLGALRRSFIVPPTIPKGQWVGVQAFALHPQTLAMLNSNATVVGVW